MFGTFLLPFSVKGIFRRLFNILKQQISLPFRILQVQKSQPFRAEPYSRIADVASLSRESPEEKKTGRDFGGRKDRGENSPPSASPSGGKRMQASYDWFVLLLILVEEGTWFFQPITERSEEKPKQTQITFDRLTLLTLGSLSVT